MIAPDWGLGKACCAIKRRQNSNNGLAILVAWRARWGFAPAQHRKMRQFRPLESRIR
jgi:hypothetical protein